MLRRSILARILSAPSTSPIPSLHRLLSAAAPAVSLAPRFAVEDYLINTCGLTRAQALKASTKLSHIKSPTNSDVVLSFLAGLGISTADVAAVVAKDPKILCAKVDTTLAPNVAGLTGLGLSSSEVARIISLAPKRFRCRSLVSSVQYCLPLFGSSEKLLRAISHSSSLLACNLAKVVKPNVALLRECRLSDCDIAKLFVAQPRLLSNNLEQFQAMVARAEAVGVPRGSGMFRQALQAVAFLDHDKIAAQVEYLKKTFRWSDAEVGIVVCKFPLALKLSKDMLQRKSEFLISEVGLEPAYIAHRPSMLSLSLEGRLRPRYYVIKFLKENGLLKHDPSYYQVFKLTEKAFIQKFICPHKEAAPHLAENYATACGQGRAMVVTS